MDLKVLLVLYLGILVFNCLISSLLWIKSKTKHHRVQFLAYLFLLMTCLLQGLTVESAYLIRALAASTLFFGMLMFTELINLITHAPFQWKKYSLIYGASICVTILLANLDVDINIMALPALMGATYPLLSTGFKALTDKTLKLSFITRCFIWSALINAIHDLDYAYVYDKPDYLLVGFIFAFFTIFAIMMFSSAAVMENLSIENTTMRMQIEYRAMLANSSKLASLGQMAGGVAHEINNPLAIIQLHTDQIKRSLAKGELDADKLTKTAEAISGTVSRIVQIITSLKYFSRDASQDPLTLISIKEIISETLSFCEMRFQEQGVKIELGDIPDKNILCRPVQLIQAILNLLNNSFEAVAASAGPTWIKIDARVITNSMEITISDSGPGIPHAIKDRIFDPFFTTKEIGKGMGLGLSASFGLIESQKGLLTLDETSSHTSFIIKIPTA